MVVMNAGHANVFTGRAGREACVTTGGGQRQTEPGRRRLYLSSASRVSFSYCIHCSRTVKPTVAAIWPMRAPAAAYGRLAGDRQYLSVRVVAKLPRADKLPQKRRRLARGQSRTRPHLRARWNTRGVCGQWRGEGFHCPGDGADRASVVEGTRQSLANEGVALVWFARGDDFVDCSRGHARIGGRLT